MKLRIQIIISLLLLTIALFSCSGNKKYHIGVSQCVGGKWRDKVNEEMLAAQHLYQKDAKVDITNADNNTGRQVQQIDSMINAGIDLLVVAPNEYGSISQSLARAKKKGIPVVLFDRKAKSSDYTAFIGGNNIEAGRDMGEYAISLVRRKITAGFHPYILEIIGPKTISPSRERHLGFKSVMKDYPDITYRTVPSNWTYKDTYRIMRSLLLSGLHPDVVFCHSDLAAFGAYRAAKDFHIEHSIAFLGVDGLPGKGQGISFVQKGILAGTYVYPTHGGEIIYLGLKILEKKPYHRMNDLQGIVVSPDNANIVAIQSNELMNQNHNLITIQYKLEKYLELYHIYRNVFVVSLLALIILIVDIYLVIHAIRKTQKANLKMKELAKEQEIFREKNSFLNSLYKVVDKNISNSNLKIENLGDELGMSRVQIYRKIKSVLGVTPSEFLKTMRLEKARQLLQSSNKSISEVAFSVGFSSLSYFTTCYKQQYGVSPSDDRG
jgi:ABC-type sugar transport system substrate-binding protein/AraC-like DNA-binding protein